VRLRLADHLVDVRLVEAGGTLDADLLLLTGAEILGRYVTMPFASMSKVTSICGTPRGAGGMPTRSKRPRVRFWLAISRSPWRTWMETAVCPSAAVEKIWLLRVGMVVLRGMSRVMTDPRVSMPRERGVTSRRRTSLTSPPRMPPWMAAPPRPPRRG
jgi:hypothetical protein